MGLGSDDSGAFRVAPAGGGARGEIRLTPRAAVPPANATNQLEETAPAQAAASGDRIALKPAANAQVRVTGLPPVKLPPPAAARPSANQQPQHSSAGADAQPASPAVRPPRAIDTERWVRLPSGGHVALRFQRWAKRVSVSARKLEFPSQCPCCMRAADAQYDAHVAKTRERQNAAVWTFPYCRSCLVHVHKARWMRYGARMSGVMLALSIGTIAFLIGGLVGGAMAGLIAGLAAWIAGERFLLRRLAAGMASTCVCHGPAVRFAEFYGSVQHFDFASTAYADAFRRANEKKLA